MYATISPMCAPYADYAHIIVIICCLTMYSVCTLPEVFPSARVRNRLCIHACMHLQGMFRDVGPPYWLAPTVQPFDSMSDVSIHIDRLRTGCVSCFPPRLISADCLHAAGLWDSIRVFLSFLEPG